MVLRNITAVTVSQPVNGQVARRRWWPDPQTPVTSRSVHPAALAVALDLAGGNLHRLQFLPDGSIIVANRERGR